MAAKSDVKIPADIGKPKKAFKVVVIGNSGVGKTSLVKRYTTGEYRAGAARDTIGCDIFTKMINWQNKMDVFLHLHDTGGSERFKCMAPQYYRNAVGCLLFYAVDDPESFKACVNWKKLLDQHAHLPNDAPVSCVLVANKCDLPTDQNAPDPAAMEQFCHENGILHWFLTSAKDNINIETAFKFLVQDILSKEIDLQLEAVKAENIKLTVQQKPPDKKGCCGSKKPINKHPPVHSSTS